MNLLKLPIISPIVSLDIDGGNGRLLTSSFGEE